MSGVGPRSANTYNTPAPAHYVAGVGRGATGFTTRSDIGPAAIPVPEVSFGEAPAGYVAGRGRGMGDLAREQGEMGKKYVEQDRGDYSESNYDEFSGYSERLFSSAMYDEDDAEADRIYDSIDEQLDNRRKRRREQQMLQEMKSNARPKIADQFADLKRDLAKVSQSEWESIPDVGDHSLKLKQRKREEVFTPLPDHIIDTRTAMSTAVDPSLGNTSVLGMAEARGTVLTLKLDKMSDSVTGQTVIDPKGYLTDLNSLKITSDAEIGDIKKARTLLNSVTTTNPKHGAGWIAAARVEEYAGKMLQARKIIKQGCDLCPDNEDVWLEAVRLHSNESAKVIMANAVKHVPTSVKLWIKASDLETNPQQKKVILRRGLEFIPNSVILWRHAIELEDVDDARIMLTRAVECIPHCVDMWLALAKLETYENAKKVLNMARENIPTEPSIWISACKLEESHGNDAILEKIVEKALLTLSQYEVMLDRTYWLQQAQQAEETNYIKTCIAIVRNTIHLGLDEENQRQTWLDDADACLSHSPVYKETARAIYQHALAVYPSKKHIWLPAIQLEKEFGTRETVENILQEAVKNCPQAEILWLMAAKEKWLGGDIPAARAILVEAFETIPNSEQIWLAAIKLEWENRYFERTSKLLSKAREAVPSARIWMKSALLEHELGNYDGELSLLDTAIAKYPTFYKYYLMAAEMLELKNELGKAKEYLKKGVQVCETEHNVLLYIRLTQLEEKQNLSKARSVIEIARMKIPRNEMLWLESIRLERRHDNPKLADNLMAKALQECPMNGHLWAENLLTCPKNQTKSKSMDALKKCDNNPQVILAIARIFEREHKYAKAVKWYIRCVTLDPDFGDAWIYYYVLEIRQHGLGSAQTEEIVAKCVHADPHHGELWVSISKKTENRHCDSATILKKGAEKVLSTAPAATLEERSDVLKGAVVGEEMSVEE